VHEWLERAAARLGPEYAVSDDERELLLELARVAAHESGDRTNAPLVSYLVGLAHGRHPEHSLGEIVRRIDVGK
jgi:hypothetical protein